MERLHYSMHKTGHSSQAIVLGHMADVTRLDVLSSDLICPVCLEIPTCKIYQCINGHPVCSLCHKKCTGKCPTCRVALGNTNIRSLVHEGIVDLNFKVCCRWCNSPMPSTKLHDHERICPMSVVDISKFQMKVDDLKHMLIVKRRAQIVESLKDYCIKKPFTSKANPGTSTVLKEVSSAAFFSLVKSYTTLFRRCQGKMENVTLLIFGQGNCNRAILRSSTTGVKMFPVPLLTDNMESDFFVQISEFVRTNRRQIVCAVALEDSLNSTKLHLLDFLKEANIIYLSQKRTEQEHTQKVFKRFVSYEGSNVTRTSPRFHHIDCRWYVIQSLLNICYLNSPSEQVLFLKDMSRRMCLNTNIADSLASLVL
jgi:hypothetical protein